MSEQNAKTYCVIGLTDPSRNGQVFFIATTGRTPSERYGSILANAPRNEQLLSMLKDGIVPGLVTLEDGCSTSSNAKERAREWMELGQQKGWPLLNELDEF